MVYAPTTEEVLRRHSVFHPHRLLPTTPHSGGRAAKKEPTRHPALKENQSIFDVLPNEIIGAALDRLAPHEQVGFALSSRRGCELSNYALKDFGVPSPAQVSVSLADDWMARLHQFPYQVRYAVLTTMRYCPPSNIFFELNTVLGQQAHVCLASAIIGLEEKDLGRAEADLLEAKFFAFHNQVALPDVSNVEAGIRKQIIAESDARAERYGKKVAMDNALNAAMECAFNSDAAGATRHVEQAKIYAAEAEVDLPDISEIDRLVARRGSAVP